MRREHCPRGEEAVIGGDQRQARGVGQRDQAGFNGVFQRQAVAVQFHDTVVGEGLGEAGEQRLGLGLLPLGQ